MIVTLFDKNETLMRGKRFYTNALLQIVITFKLNISAKKFKHFKPHLNV